MDGRTGLDEITKRQNVLSVIRERKLWRAIIANDLKRRGTKKKKKYRSVLCYRS